MAHPDNYEVDVELGIRQPLPGYISDWNLVRWIGVTKAELQAMPWRDVEEARIIMKAEHQAREDQGKGRK